MALTTGWTLSIPWESEVLKNSDQQVSNTPQLGDLVEGRLVGQPKTLKRTILPVACRKIVVSSSQQVRRSSPASPARSSPARPSAQQVVFVLWMKIIAAKDLHFMNNWRVSDSWYSIRIIWEMHWKPEIKIEAFKFEKSQGAKIWISFLKWFPQPRRARGLRPLQHNFF